MIIDAHTHIFPKEVAAAMFMNPRLQPSQNLSFYTDATKRGLLASMKEAKIDYSLVLPVVRAPYQFTSTNEFAAEINGKDGIFSFGSIHPDNDDIMDKLTHIKSLGLKGVKLHPDDQCTFIDDPRYINIIRTCIELDLYVAIHAGIGSSHPYPVYCPPARAAHMLDLVYAGRHPQKPHIILCHIGGNDMFDEVERCLVGRNVYFDLSLSLNRINKIQLLRIIQDHGADRILFGTDSPWGDQKQYLKILHDLPLFDDEREQILWKNAAQILEIPK